ncbi:MAG: glutamate-5-semialdehyde dehydrogenase, partial [Candidatus Brocadiia bacterium]|nr:glutamate-5-semialdehyde dehydrogenase [Candidatus Brocadiia bacterium]
MQTAAITPELEAIGRAARAAARALARTPSAAKDRALRAIADALETQHGPVLAANARDLEAGRERGLSDALLDRLMLDSGRLRGMADDARSVAALPDPVGEQLDTRTLANGLVAGRRRVPLGVVGVIYESRPNVTVDIAALCLKSGNACILRGGSEAIHSNTALAALVRDAVESAGVSRDAVQFIDDTDRALVTQLLRMRDYIDLLIPRGGADLVRFVSENATMPAVTGGIGVCHTYVDRSADAEMANRIGFNAKV